MGAFRPVVAPAGLLAAGEALGLHSPVTLLGRSWLLCRAGGVVIGHNPGPWVLDLDFVLVRFRQVLYFAI